MEMKRDEDECWASGSHGVSRERREKGLSEGGGVRCHARSTWGGLGRI